MASTSETGHAKNTANFENPISFCIGYGTDYNPSKTGLTIPALQTQLAGCTANVAAVTSSIVAYNNAVNSRNTSFDGLTKLSTRLVNALDATDASVLTVKNARSFVDKLRGSKKTKTSAVSVAAPAAVDPAAPVLDTPKSISSSQQSHSNMVEHFSRLIETLSAEPTYLPNETDLQIVSLNTRLTALKNTNTGVINAYTTISNSRISRDQSLYNLTNGLVQTAKDVKMYVKSIYGATGAKYKQISGVEFKTVKG